MTRLLYTSALVATLGLGHLAEASPRVPPTVALTLASPNVASGNTVAGSVALSTAAPAGGVIVQLTISPLTTAGFVSPLLGSASQVAKLQVTIPQGATTVPFKILASIVSTPSNATVQASSTAGSAAATLTVNPATVKAIVLSPSGVVGGKSATLTVTLDGRASAAGAPIALSSSILALQLPTTLTVAPNATSVSASVTPTPVATRTSGTITAKSTGAFLGTPASASFTIVPPSAASIQLDPSVVLGGMTLSTATVVLNAPAPAGGIPVSIASSVPDAHPPSSVTVPQGLNRQTFTIVTTPVSSVISATISVPIATGAITPTLVDGSSNTISVGETNTRPAAVLTIAPVPLMQSLVASPAPANGGDSIAVSLTWSGVTSATVPIPASIAQLSTNHPEVVAIPSSIVLDRPPTSTVRGVTHAPSADQSVVLTATMGKQSVSTTFLVKKPIPPLASFTLRPTQTSGGNIIAQFTLNPAVSSAVVIQLTTDHPEIVQLPSSISVSPSSVPTPFTLHATKPSAATMVTITAIAGGQATTATFTALP